MRRDDEGQTDGSPEAGGTSGESSRAGLVTAIEIAALVVFVAASTAFAIVTPPRGAPDEEGHAIYAQAVSHGVLPTPSPETPAPGSSGGSGRFSCGQAHHPPLYYAIVGGVYALTGRRPAALAPIGRAVSILAGLAALLLMRAAMHRAFPGRAAAIAAGLGLAAASVTFTYIMGSFNNDPLAVLTVCASVYLMVRALEAERPMPWLLGLGACLGVGLLTKLTAAVIVLPVVVAAVGAARREAEGDRRGRAMVLALAALGVAAVISGPWFVRNQVLFGTPTFNCAHRPVFDSMVDVIFDWKAAGIVIVLTLEELVVGAWWPEWLLRTWSTLVADLIYFGAASSQSRPPWLVLLPIGVAAVALAGLVRTLRKSREDDARGLRQRCVLWLLMLLPVLSTLGILHQTMLVDTIIVRWPGRYIATVIPALGMGFALGIGELVPARARRWLPLAALIFAVALNVLGVIRVRGFYERAPGVRYVPGVQGVSAVGGGEVSVHAANLPQIGDHLHAVGEGVHLRVRGVEPPHRHLDDPEAEAQRDEDQLRIEGPALEALVRKDALGRRPGEHFEAALGVADA